MMNKKELVGVIANKVNLSKKDVEQVLQAYQNAIFESLAQNVPVRLTGFGTFDVKNSPARLGRNPRTGVAIQLPARRMPKFTPGEGFKAAVSV